MMQFIAQIPSEYLGGLWWWLVCSLHMGICDAQQLAAPIVLTNEEVAATLILSLTGLGTWLCWLLRLLRFVLWHFMDDRRQSTLEELLVDYMQVQDEAQREYLRKLLKQ